MRIGPWNQSPFLQEERFFFAIQSPEGHGEVSMAFAES